MTNPDEILNEWEVLIKADKRNKNTNGLKHVLQDLKMELSDAEEWVSRYESLIDAIEDYLNRGSKIK